MAFGLLNFLPEDPAKKAAARQGLLSFGAAMLNGRGNFGNVLGQGIGAGSQGYHGALQQAQKDQMEAAQLKLLQGKDARAQSLQDTISSAFGGPGAPQPGGNPASSQPQTVSAPQSGIAPASAPSRKFPLDLNAVARIKALGGPDLSAEYKMAHEGFERKQGSTYVGPDGSVESYARLGDGQVQGRDGSVSNAAGYTDAVGQSEFAKQQAAERARAEFDVLDPTKFVGPDGAPIASTRAAFIQGIGQLPRIGATPPARPPAKQAGPAGFPVISKQEQAGRDDLRLQILHDELAKEVNPTNRAAIEREIARAGGGRGQGQVLQSAAQAKQQLGSVDTQLKAGQGLNENWIKEVLNPVQVAGKTAKDTLVQLDTIQNINFQTGWGAETKAGAANILASLGVKDAAKYAGDAQKFQQVGMEKLLSNLSAQVGPQTEGDAQRAQQTWLRLANTPAANQYIADMARAQAEITAKKAEYYSRALPLARAAGDLTEIDRRWAKIAPSVWDRPSLARYKGK